MNSISSSLKVVNDHLLKDLTELGLWNPDMKNRLMYENGSIQVRLSLFLIPLALFVFL